jgi:hypothetical protein
MSKSAIPPFWRRLALFVGLYALAYVAAAFLDLGTTAVALRRAGASEGNVYAAGAAGYSATRAWAITAVGGLFIGASLVWAALAADKGSAACLRAPMRSFTKFYVNPFARGVIDRSPLHMLSFVIAFVPLRLLAAANNALIWVTGTAPLGRLIGLIGRHSTAAIGFWLVVGALFYLLAIAASPLAARLVVWLRREPAPGPRAMAGAAVN